MTRWWWMLAVVLAGCPAKIDPLAAERRVLRTMPMTPLPMDWEPDAVLVVSDAQLGEVLTSGVRDLFKNEVTHLRAPLGAELLLRPELTSIDLVVSPSSACNTCLVVAGRWSGLLNVFVGARDGLAFERTLPWTATTEAVMSVYTSRGTSSMDVLVRKARGSELDLHVEFLGLSEPYKTLASAVLETRVVERTAEGALSRPTTLLELPAEGALAARGLRIRGISGGIAVDVRFSTIERASAETPDPGDGWAITIPTATLLGLVRAAALSDERREDYFVEPVALELSGGDSFRLGLRVWKPGRRHAWRDYEVEGRVVHNLDGDLSFIGEAVKEVGKKGWGASVLGPLVKARALRQLGRAASQTLPGGATERIGRWTFSVEVEGFVAAADGLEVWGHTTIRPAAE